MPIVNHTILYTLNFVKRVNLVLSVLTIVKKEKGKGKNKRPESKSLLVTLGNLFNLSGTQFPYLHMKKIPTNLIVLL